MRNILLFPDGTEQDFMYPPNREIEVGTKLEIAMMDGSIHILRVAEIIKEEKKVCFKLVY
jgi:hypothetical protein